jgi:hypothetical protein
MNVQIRITNGELTIVLLSDSEVHGGIWNNFIKELLLMLYKTKHIFLMGESPFTDSSLYRSDGIRKKYKKNTFNFYYELTDELAEELSTDNSFIYTFMTVSSISSFSLFDSDAFIEHTLNAHWKNVPGEKTIYIDSDCGIIHITGIPEEEITREMQLIKDLCVSLGVEFEG